MPQLVGRRGRGDVDHLVHTAFELLEVERAVVARRRQAEAEVDERILAGHLAVEHAPDLRDGHVGLVDDEEVVVRQVIHERPRRAAARAPAKRLRVVLDARAVAGLTQHLQVVAGPVLQTLRLQHPPLLTQPDEALVQLPFNLDDRILQFLAGSDEVLGRVDVDLRALGEDLAGERVELHDALHVVAEELDADGDVLVRGHDLQRVAAHAEARAGEVVVVALVLHLDEAARQLLPVQPRAPRDALDEREVLGGRAQAVDARDGGDDEHVPPRHQRAGRRVAELVYLVVDVRLLLDIRVGRGDVRLRLVVVVVGDEVLDGVLGEEVAELLGQLGCERLVGRDDERGLLDGLDGLGHGVRLAGAGDAEEGLVAHAAAYAVGEPVDGLRLVAARLEVGDDAKRRSGLGWVERGHAAGFLTFLISLTEARGATVPRSTPRSHA